MGILSLFQRKQKNTQVVLKSNTSLERAADSILSQRGKQIVDGLNKPTASTGTPMDKLHGGAKRMAQRAQQRQAPRPAARRCEADSLT